MITSVVSFFLKKIYCTHEWCLWSPIHLSFSQTYQFDCLLIIRCEFACEQLCHGAIESLSRSLLFTNLTISIKTWWGQRQSIIVITAFLVSWSLSLKDSSTLCLLETKTIIMKFIIVLAAFVACAMAQKDSDAVVLRYDQPEINLDNYRYA